jgi:hypothetical protein
VLLFVRFREREDDKMRKMLKGKLQEETEAFINQNC